MPNAMTVLAHQTNDSNLRRAARAYKARAPIFLTQATEADRAEAAAQQRQWQVKKRLADILEPANAVLSHATMPKKLYRSLSQAKKSGAKMKRRSKVSCFSACASLPRAALQGPYRSKTV